MSESNSHGWRISVDTGGTFTDVVVADAEGQGGYESGWNTRYVTDLARPVAFYLRGNEFTEQLYHFVECVRCQRGSTIASFADGAETDVVIEKIAIDGGRGG